MMETMTLWAIVLGLLLVTLLVLLVVDHYWKLRGRRVVVCPETRKPAGVELDTRRALRAALMLDPGLKLRDCTRWPERRNCGQECLAEIASAPDGCLVRSRLEQWYSGRSCVLCGRRLSPIAWDQHRPALMNDARVTLEWPDVPAEQLPEILATHEPVCWNCHVAETFRRRFPHLVVEREWRHRDASDEGVSAGSRNGVEEGRSMS